MAGLKSDSQDMIVEINVTPLVDVVLVLLVIFMMTAPMIYQAAIKVELPKVSSGEQTDKVTLKFMLLADGSVVLGNDRVSNDQLPMIIRSALGKDPTTNAIIGADKSLTHGAVMSFIDQLKQNGITRFAIGVENKQ